MRRLLVRMFDKIAVGSMKVSYRLRYGRWQKTKREVLPNGDVRFS